MLAINHRRTPCNEVIHHGQVSRASLVKQMLRVITGDLHDHQGRVA